MNKFFVFIIIILFYSCIDNPVSTDETSSSKSSISLSLDMSAAPQDVVSVAGLLTRNDYDSVKFSFIINDTKATAEINDLATGEWLLKVDALDEQKNVLYTGNTRVNVIAGQISPVYLQLDPVSGGLKIIVTWGNTPGIQPFLFMAQNAFGEWRVLTMNTNGSGFSDLTAGAYPIWLDNKDEIIYRLDAYTLAKYNMNTADIKILGSAPRLINFIRYSPFMNRIVCDYKVAPDIWNIAHMNIDGSDFREVIVDSAWTKRPVPYANSDWIYYQSNVSGTVQLYKVKFDGSQETQLTFENEEAAFPSFNHAGTTLIYSTKSEQQQSYQIIIKSLRQDVPRILDFSNEGEAIYPTFTKDDQKIIYILVTGPTYYDRQLWIMSTDGSEKIEITPRGGYTNIARPITW